MATVVQSPTFVVVESDDVTAVVVRDETFVAVSAPGPQGPPGEQGPPGTPGGSAYVHTQSSPSATWVIDHDLGRQVHVTLYDSVSPPLRLVYADVDHGSLNQTTVTFPAPATGLAVLS